MSDAGLNSTETESKSAKTDSQEQWTYHTFGCLDDWRMCIVTFVLPCYTVGRNGEAMGENCLQTGLLYGLGCIGIAPVLRWRLRMRRNLMGNMATDVIIHTVCPCCALIQENKELYGVRGSIVDENMMPLGPDIHRQ